MASRASEDEGESPSAAEQAWQQAHNLLTELRPETLQALARFYDEQQLTQETSADTADAAEDGKRHVKEDFRLSQFWYSDDTAETFADEVFHSCTHAAAFVCTPSAFRAFHRKYRSAGSEVGDAPDSRVAAPFEAYLLEVDNRFGDVYGKQFVHFDLFQPPEALPRWCKASTYVHTYVQDTGE